MPSVDIGIFTTDRALVVRSWDAGLESLSGIAAARTLGRSVADIVADLEARGLLQRFQQVLETGAAQVLAPALHHFLIPCPPRTPSPEFDRMQQRVTINPLVEQDSVVGLAIVIEDVTARLAGERALARAVGSDDWRRRQASVEELAKTADDGLILALIENIKRNHHNFSLLSGALRLLKTADVDVTKVLVALLDGPDRDLRIQVALALGEHRDPIAIDALLHALDDEDVNVRFHAIESLGRLRADTAVERLLEIVAARDFYLAFAALDALTAINDVRIAPALTPLLHDDLLKVPVADALGALGDERAIPALLGALNASAADVPAIVDALVRIHDRFEDDVEGGAHVSQQIGDGLDSSGRQHVVAAVTRANGEQLPALVRMLGWLRGDDVAHALVALLAMPSVRGQVVEALTRHGEAVVELLLQQLASEDREIRRAAVIALGRVGSRRASQGLIALLDEERDLVIAATGALARIGDAAAFEPLLVLLDHDELSVRQSAVGALNSIGHPELAAAAMARLRDPSPRVRESAVRIVGYFGFPEALDAFMELAADPEEPVRRAVLEHLPYIEHPDAVPRLVRAVMDETAGARATAARALGKVEGDAARHGLRSALDDAEPWVRYYAARSLAEQRDASAAGALLGLARGDAAMHVRIAAVDALGDLGGEQIVGDLRQFAASGETEFAAAALAALGRTATIDVMPDLEKALRDETPARRRAAVSALAAQGTATAVDALAWAAAADPDSAVAQAAVDALQAVAAHGSGALDAIDALLTLLGDSNTHDRAARALQQLPVARIPDLERGLQHARPEVRRATVEALGRIHRTEATQLLEKALADESPMIREAAVVTLARVGSRAAEATIARLASQDPSRAVRRAAAAALARSRGTGGA